MGAAQPEGPDMTPDEIEKRFAAIERQLLELKWELLGQAGVTVIPGFGPIGTFKGDPEFDEAVRLGRKYRDLVNRDAYVDPLLDDEPDAKKPVKKARRKKAKPGAADAHP